MIVSNRENNPVSYASHPHVKSEEKEEQSNEEICLINKLILGCILGLSASKLMFFLLNPDGSLINNDHQLSRL